LCQAGDGAERAQTRLHFDGHAQTHLRVVFDLLSFTGSRGRTPRFPPPIIPSIFCRHTQGRRRARLRCTNSEMHRPHASNKAEPARMSSVDECASGTPAGPQRDAQSPRQTDFRREIAREPFIDATPETAEHRRNLPRVLASGLQDWRACQGHRQRIVATATVTAVNIRAAAGDGRIRTPTRGACGGCL